MGPIENQPWCWIPGNSNPFRLLAYAPIGTYFCVSLVCLARAVVLLLRLRSRSDFNFSEFQWFWRLQFYFLYKVHHLNVDGRTRLRIVCRVAAFLIIFLLLWVPAILDRLFIWIFPSEEFHWLNKAHEFSVYTQPLSLAIVWCTTSSFLRLVCHWLCA